jgi:hypothetical protein
MHFIEGFIYLSVCGEIVWRLGNRDVAYATVAIVIFTFLGKVFFSSYYAMMCFGFYLALGLGATGDPAHTSMFRTHYGSIFTIVGMITGFAGLAMLLLH